MKNPPKFDIKLSFTGRSLKENKKHIDNSLLLEKLLLNKKINIHLKINLDKLEHQYNKKKLLDSKYKIEDESEEEEEEIINNLYTNDSKELLSERKDKIIPKIKLEYSQMNYLRNQTIHKNSRSLSNQNMKISKFKNSTLVLDLDETLVYVTDTKNNFFGLPQIQFEYYIFDESEKFIKENCNKLGIHKLKKSISYLTIRPGFKKFINEVKKYYEEIIVFTSSQYSYAEEIIKIIDKQKIISKIYSRKDCSFYNDVFYKDLNKIKEDLSHIIIIDNYPESYLLQHFNGLPISSFMGDIKDNELLKLLPLLEKLSQVKDVRNYIRQIVEFNGEKINFNKAYELLKIKKNNICSGDKDCIINYNYIKNNNSTNIKDKSLDSKTYFETKKNFDISEFISNGNVKTGENINNEEEDDEKILVNDPDNYCYIEKKIYPSTSRNKKIKRNNIPYLSNNFKIKNRNKNNIINQSIILDKIRHNKTICKDKKCKSFKPQIINAIPIKNSKKNLLLSNNNEHTDISKEINNFLLKSINKNNKIINRNQNISYFNSQDDSFFSKNSKINSVKNIKIDLINNKKNNIPLNISSYKNNNNLVEKTRKKNLSCIPEIFEKGNISKHIQNNIKIDLNLLENKNNLHSKNFKNIPINKTKKLSSFNNKKNS